MQCLLDPYSLQFNVEQSDSSALLPYPPGMTSQIRHQFWKTLLNLTRLSGALAQLDDLVNNNNVVNNTDILVTQLFMKPLIKNLCSFVSVFNIVLTSRVNS